MKKMYLFLLLFVSAFCLQAQATNWTVNVKDDFYENPSNFTPLVGDSITWVWMGTHSHTVTSTTVPSGAASLSSPSQSTGTYGYKIMVAGAYVYNCTVHGVAMSGGFTATNPSSGIQAMALRVTSSAYPNPFGNKITINTKNADQVLIYNSVGQQIQSANISTIEANTDFDMTGNPSGFYYYSTFKQGVVVERKVIVKAN